MNMHEHTLFGGLGFTSLRYIPQRGIAGSYDNTMKNHQTVFHSG